MRTMMIALALLVVTAATGHADGRPGKSTKATKMSTEKAVRLDRALSHLRELMTQEVPYLREAQAICQESQIDYRELLAGMVYVVFEGPETGAIHRAPEVADKPESKPPESPPKPPSKEPPKAAK